MSDGRRAGGQAGHDAILSAMSAIYEACVTSVAQARTAERAGADRLELCTRISTGGLTPPLPRLVAVRAVIPIPIHVMIRPRSGNYVYSTRDVEAMIRSIADAREAGAEGVVLGLLTADRRIDTRGLRALAPVIRGLSVTFHRAFDEVAAPVAAMEELVALGVHRILTSGGAPTARKGVAVLAELVAGARGRIGIIACGKVRARHAAALMAATGVSEVHAHLTSAVSMRALANAVHAARQ